MKNLLCLCLALSVFQFSMAQAKESAAVKPVYFDKPLPSFSLQPVDSSKNYTKEDLPKNKQVILIWFNPDCEHCQAETKLIREHIEDFADAHIVMATYQPYEKMKTFYDTYEIKKYPTISMGRDTKYFFGNYFQVHFVPFIAIYDKNYKLKKVFEGGATMEQMAEALKE